MIRVTVESIPMGVEQASTVLGIVTIANESHLAENSTYSVKLDGEHLGTVKHQRSFHWSGLLGRAMRLIAKRHPR